MEQIQSLVGGICMTSLTVGLCSMLKAGKGMERQIHFLLSLLFVIAMIAPFREISIEEIMKDTTKYINDDAMQEHTEAIQNQLVKHTHSQTREAVGQILTQAEIPWKNLDVTVHIDYENRIYISEVSVQCMDVQKANELLCTALGEGVEINVTEMDG